MQFIKFARNLAILLSASSCLSFAGISLEWEYSVGTNSIDPEDINPISYGISSAKTGPSGYTVLVVRTSVMSNPQPQIHIQMLDPNGVQVWLSDDISEEVGTSFEPLQILQVSPYAATFAISTNSLPAELKLFAYNKNADPTFSTLTVSGEKLANLSSVSSMATSLEIPSIFPANTFYTVSNPPGDIVGPASGIGTIIRKYKLDTVSSTALIAESTSGTTGTNFIIKWQSTVSINYQVQESPDMNTWTDVGLPITGNGTQLSWSTPLGSGSKFYRIVQL